MCTGEATRSRRLHFLVRGKKSVQVSSGLNSPALNSSEVSSTTPRMWTHTDRHRYRYSYRHTPRQPYATPGHTQFANGGQREWLNLVWLCQLYLFLLDLERGGFQVCAIQWLRGIKKKVEKDLLNILSLQTEPWVISKSKIMWLHLRMEFYLITNKKTHWWQRWRYGWGYSFCIL